MKKLAFFGMMAAVALTMSSCFGGNQQPQQTMEEEPDSVDDYMPFDQTIYGLCGNGTAMNTLQLLTDSGDTLNLDLTMPRRADRCLVVCKPVTVWLFCQTRPRRRP